MGMMLPVLLAAARLQRRVTLEDASHDLADYLIGNPYRGAQHLAEDAVRRARALTDPYADNATALVAHVD